jgi:predicted FMN-binding regulatory protein PaiB
MGESPQAFINEMLASIVGLEIGITRLVGKSKLGSRTRRSATRPARRTR